MHKNKKYAFSFIVCFISILLLPSMSKVLKIEKHFKITEKRKLAHKPEFEFNKNYALNFEKYYNDNFGLRNLLVRWNNQLKINFFKSSPKPENALFGKNGFLFYNSLNDYIYLSYTHKNTFSFAELKEKYGKLSLRKTDLAKRNIIYVCGFWPNKHTIYPEHLPAKMQIQSFNKQSLADQFATYFKEQNFSFFDVRDDLQKEKANHQLYCKLDSHWNKLGAFIAYQSFCKQTYNQLHLEPYSLSDFEIKYTKTHTGDLVKIMGVDSIKNLYDFEPELTLKDTTIKIDTINAEGFPKNTIITINNNCKNSLTAVIYRDSYMKNLVPFLSLHFHKTIYVWFGYTNKVIDMVNPDIVISAPVERYLKDI